jgi:glycine cleavage system H protein
MSPVTSGQRYGTTIRAAAGGARINGETNPSFAKKNMSPPNDRTYLESHEWHKLEADTITIGITQIAADELTDITYVALPKVGEKFTAGARFGEVESVKATSDLYLGASGTVIAVNENLNTEPGLINTDPYEAGWMLKLKAANPAEVKALLSADDYLKKTGH